MPLLTVGHGPQDRAALGARLAEAGVDRIVDVRRFPGSRNNPDVARESLEEWLPAAGIGYRWDERLGGRRRLPPGEAGAGRWGGVGPVAGHAPPTPTAGVTPPLDPPPGEGGPAAPAGTGRGGGWGGGPPRPWRSCAARACGGGATGG